MNVSIFLKLIDQVTGPMRRIQNDVKAAGVAMSAGVAKGADIFGAAKASAAGNFQSAANLSLAAQGVSDLSRKIKDLVGAPIELAQGFEFAIARLSAIGGYGKDQMATLRELALQLGGDTVFTASQAAEGLTYLAQAGFSATEAMAAAKGTLDLAAAGALDLGQASQITSDVIRGMNLTANESIRVADVLAQAANASSTSVQELGEAFSYAAPMAASLGQSLEDTSALLSVMANNGIKGSRAGTALNAMMAGMIGASKRGDGVIKALGLRIVDNAGKMLPAVQILEQFKRKTDSMHLSQDKLGQIMVRMFGREALPAVSALLKGIGANNNALTEMADKMRTAGGAASKMANEQLDNAYGASERLNGALESLKIELGSAVLPAIKAMRDRLAVIVTSVTAWAKAHPELVRNLMRAAMALGAITAALAAFLYVGAGLAAFIGIFKIAVGGITAAIVVIKALSGALLLLAANPVVLVIAGVVALAAAAYLVYRNWGRIRAFLLGVFDAIATKVSKVTSYLSGVWDRFMASSVAVKVILSTLALPFLPLIMIIYGAVQAIRLLHTHWQAISDFVRGAIDHWLEGMRILIDAIKGWDNSFIALGDLITSVFERIKGPIGEVIDWISDKLTIFADTAAYKSLKQIIDLMRTSVPSTMHEIKSVFVPPEQSGLASAAAAKPTDLGGTLKIELQGAPARVTQMQMRGPLQLSVASGVQGGL